MFTVPEKYRLKNHPILGSTAETGNNGFFVIPHHRIADYFYNCQVSDGEGWEHVSITLSSKTRKVERCPTWEEMCYIKDLFWSEEDCVIQYHPPKSNYVSCHPYCLHKWRQYGTNIPVPSPLLVGPLSHLKAKDDHAA